METFCPATESARTATKPSIDALYLHIPFCFHKCHYCDFYSIVDDADRNDHQQRQTDFTQALIAELDHWADRYDEQDQPLRPQTIFVGGGTPTLLQPELWQQLLTAMKSRGILNQVTEFTVEANPETVTDELLATLVVGGVNRISMGAQSFNPRLLKQLERWHDPDRVSTAMQQVRAAGIDNVNLDLIFAIPTQTLDELHADLDAALALQPNHMSCYSLIYEPNTPMAKKLQLGRVSAVGETLEGEMYEAVIDRFAQVGFDHYEVSNWAKQPQQRCQHNLLYWENANWLGLGPNAASHLDGHRFKNEPHLGRYIKQSPQPPHSEDEHLTDNQRCGEVLMLHLRLIDGIPLTHLHQLLPDNDWRWATIDELLKWNMLEKTSTHLKLTKQGLFVADNVVTRLL